MTIPQFKTWLHTVKLTAPFTNGDASELLKMIHAALGPAPEFLVDVVHRDGKVFVRMETAKDIYVTVLDVA